MKNPSHGKRIFSGIQPTGNLTIGNYLGAVKRWVKLQAEKVDTIYCIVDLHAATIWQDPKELRESTRELVASLLACGLNPKESILFNQSQVSAHSELAWIFNCVARMGWLSRMTQFKDKAGKDREKASVGLFAYPTLMAADILSYKATHVPVGEDQKQHLELTRDIASKFNSDYNVDDFFPLPKPLIEGSATRVMSLRDGQKKMSKSDASDFSRINLNDSADLIHQKVKKAKTDPYPLPDTLDELKGRPEAINLVNIYAALSDKTPETVLKEFSGREFSYFKPKLAELTVAQICPISEKMRALQRDPSYIDSILDEGSTTAAKIASPIINDVYEIVGMIRKRCNDKI